MCVGKIYRPWSQKQYLQMTLTDLKLDVQHNYAGWLPRWCLGEADFWEYLTVNPCFGFTFPKLGPYFGCAYLHPYCYEASRQTAVRPGVRQ